MATSHPVLRSVAPGVAEECGPMATLTALPDKPANHSLGMRSSGGGQRQNKYDGAVGITRKPGAKAFHLANIQIFNLGVNEQSFISCFHDFVEGEEQFEWIVGIAAAKICGAGEIPIWIYQCVFHGEVFEPDAMPLVRIATVVPPRFQSDLAAVASAASTPIPSCLRRT